MKPGSSNGGSALDAGGLSPPPAGINLVRVVLVTWFLLLALATGNAMLAMARSHPAGGLGFSDGSLIVSKMCSLLFYAALGWLSLVRPPAVASRAGIVPMAVALLGTYWVWLIPLLPLARLTPALGVASAAVTLAGSLAMVRVVMKLGRSFSIAPQARGLKTDGPYRLVRHPLYVAEWIAVAGLLMRYAWWAALPFLVVHLALQLRRMTYEETLLRSVFPEYDAYARRTARLVPGIW